MNHSSLKEAALGVAQATNGKINPNPDPNMHYNCWGFVAHAAGWVDRLQWLQQKHMQGLLASNTIEIDPSQATKGDILAYFQRRSLIHTAIVLIPGELVLHKPGELDPCIETIEAQKSYFPAKLVYLRVK